MTVHAQAPVITHPGALRVVSVNTVLQPLDPNAAWISVAPMPIGRAGFAIGSVNGRIYTAGGGPVDNCATVTTVEVYDPKLDRWTTGLAPLPPPMRWRPSSGTLNDFLYVVGGQSTENGCPDEALAVMQSYDPATDRWSEHPPMPTARVQVGVGVDRPHHLLYAVGGATSTYTDLDTVEVFDSRANGGLGSWATKQHLITPRAAPGVIELNGKIYAVGGQDQNKIAIETVEEFDPNANGGFGSWRLKKSRMPHPRVNASFAIVHNKIYVIGGQTRGEGIISTVDVYNPARDTWETVLSMPTARRGMGAAVVGNRIFAIGGEAKVATVGEQFTYQITATNHPTFYDAQPLPPGLTIDHERGIIYGKPIVSTQAFVATLTVANSSGSDSQDVSFFISNTPPPQEGLPSIISGTCVTGRADQPFKFRVLTTDVSADQILRATGLPYAEGIGPELTLDPTTNVISGLVASSPNGSAKSFGANLNIMQADASQSYLQLTFVSDPLFPVITSSSVASLVLNQFFSYRITADAPVNSYSYIGIDGVLNGALPAGLGFDPTTGTIFGTYCGRACNVGPGDQTASGVRGASIDGIDTIKKEPPPKIQLLVQQDGIGTGTLPLNFLFGLHDFEAEMLDVTTSPEADYSIITDDPVNSAGAAGLLHSPKMGDYVTYVVPVEKVGTYDVRVGGRAGDTQGIFQLAIDGVNHGPPQDEYAPALDYVMKDLGPFTFSSPGDKAFRFSVTGQNPRSTGAEFLCDYIDLVPHFEAETLPVKERTAATRVVQDASLSGGAGMMVRAFAPGDYVTYTVPVDTPGTYDVRIKTRPGTETGTFQLFVEGVQQGYLQRNTYVESLSESGVHDLGAIRFDTAGEKTFKFVVHRVTDSASAEIVLDDIELILTNHFEAESLVATGDKPVRQITDQNLSGGAGIVFEGTVPGDYATFTVPVPVPGSYEVKLGVRKNRHDGLVQLSIDGVNRANAKDSYASRVEYEVVDIGRVTFTEAGDTTFKFLVAGRNRDSLGYQFALDYIELVR
jgi:N-acetylneuraminic acid mutarotase